MSFPTTIKGMPFNELPLIFCIKNTCDWLLLTLSLASSSNFCYVRPILSIFHIFFSNDESKITLTLISVMGTLSVPQSPRLGWYFRHLHKSISWVKIDCKSWRRIFLSGSSNSEIDCKVGKLKRLLPAKDSNHL